MPNRFAKKLPGDDKSQICLACHDGHRQLAFWDSGKHRKNDVACNDCHVIHGKPGNPSVSPFVTTQRTLQYGTCNTCHRNIRAQINRTSHHPIVEGKVACSDCHNPHGALSHAMVKNDAAKLNEYRDLANGVLSVIDVKGRSRNYYLDVYGENLARDDMFIDVRGGRYGLFKYQLYSDSLRHNFTFGARSPYSGIGTALQTIDTSAGAVATVGNPALWSSYDLEYKRRKDGGALEFSFNSPWYVRVDANQIVFDGNRLQSYAKGTSPVHGFVDLATPVDYTTRNLSLEGGYSSKRVQVSLNFLSSKFDNDNRNRGEEVLDRVEEQLARPDDGARQVPVHRAPLELRRRQPRGQRQRRAVPAALRCALRRVEPRPGSGQAGAGLRAVADRRLRHRAQSEEEQVQGHGARPHPGRPPGAVPDGGFRRPRRLSRSRLRRLRGHQVRLGPPHDQRGRLSAGLAELLRSVPAGNHRRVQLVGAQHGQELVVRPGLRLAGARAVDGQGLGAVGPQRRRRRGHRAGAAHRRARGDAGADHELRQQREMGVQPSRASTA